jgi:hypothetical protein
MVIYYISIIDNIYIGKSFEIPVNRKTELPGFSFNF